ncbi:RHS repeat-associated core domain-containing protein [Kurthia sibirica]|nr:RHS repeat-associated core domain-containing protein [Kurthia sibirica]
MEVVKVKDTVTEYRSYEWNGYTPLGMIIKKQNESGTFETKAYQFITNHRGDVLSIRDKDDQEVGAYTYDAYGNVLTVEGDLAKENPIRYAGYYYDDETKNYYLQARYYNPTNGAFLALDPHPGDGDEPLSQNGYSYANGNPVMNVDPDGEWAFLWWMAKGALLGGFVSYIQYEVEVRLGIQKRSKSNAIAKVSFGALSGAVLGGIGVSARGIKHVKGLLKIAKKKKYLSKKELKIANYIIYGQYNLLKKVVNHFNTTPGKRSWKDVIYSNSKKYF